VPAYSTNSILDLCSIEAVDKIRAAVERDHGFTSQQPAMFEGIPCVDGAVVPGSDGMYAHRQVHIVMVI
jgi:hypothetical protein